MPACGYEFYLLMFNSISHLFAALTREIWNWTLKDKIGFHAWACNILYFHFMSLGFWKLWNIFLAKLLSLGHSCSLLISFFQNINQNQMKVSCLTDIFLIGSNMAPEKNSSGKFGMLQVIDVLHAGTIYN